MKVVGEVLQLDFEVRVAEDGEKGTKQFDDLIDGLTLISVYMRNNTGSCDKQMLSLAKEAPQILERGCSIIGVSKDTVGSHLKFADRHAIGFTLVSDPDHLFAQATDSLVEKKMYGRAFLGPTRSAYLVDRGGRLVAICEKVDPANHGQQVLSLLETVG